VSNNTRKCYLTWQQHLTASLGGFEIFNMKFFQKNGIEMLAVAQEAEKIAQ
jgi:hypothetical protein